MAQRSSRPDSEPPGTSVFVSYAREDRSWVDQLKQSLAARGVRARGDWELSAGEHYEAQLRSLVLATDAFLFILSEDAARSESCRAEAELAGAQGKQIVPVRIADHGEDDQLPAAVRAPHWIDLRGAEPVEERLEELVVAIHTDADLKARHRSLALAAGTWERNRHSKAYLLRGEALRRAESVVAELSGAKSLWPKATELQTAFVVASQTASRRRLGVMALVAAAAAAVLLGVTVIAFLEWQRAERERAEAEARRLGAQAELMLDQKPENLERSVLLAAVAADRLPSLETDRALRRGLALLPPLGPDLSTENVVRALAFNDGGTRLAVGGDGEIVRVFELSTGEPTHELPKGSGIRTLDFSGDDRFLAAAGDSDVAVWELGGAETERFRSFRGRDTSLAVLARGSESLLSAARGIKAWDLASGELGRPVGEPGDELGYYLPVVLGSQGGRAAIVSRGRIKVLDIETGDELLGIEQGDRSVAGFSHDESHLVLVAKRRVEVWSVVPPEMVGKLVLDSPAWEVAYDPVRGYLATSEESSRGVARVWHLETGREIARVAIASAIFALALSPDGGQLAIGGRGVRVRDLPFGSRRDLRQEGLVELAWSGETVLAAAVTDEKAATVWEPSSGRVVRTVVEDGPIRGLGASRDGGALATATERATTLWKVSSGDRIARIEIAPIWLEPSAGGRYLAAAEADWLGVWDGATGRELLRHRIEDGPGWMRLVFLDGDRWLLASRSGAEWVVDLESMELRDSLPAKLEGRSGAPAVAFHPDLVFNGSSGATSSGGSYRVSIGQDSATVSAVDESVPLWQIKPDELVERVVFAPDESVVAVKTADDTLHVVALPAGEEVGRLQVPGGHFEFAPGGDQLAWITDREVLVWPWSTAALVRLACERVGRDLTPEEWSRLVPDEPYRALCDDLASRR